MLHRRSYLPPLSPEYTGRCMFYGTTALVVRSEGEIDQTLEALDD
jgi:hypothetical protein